MLPRPEIELVERELGLDSVLGRESPDIPSDEGREDESVERNPEDPIDGTPLLPIVPGRRIGTPIVEPVVPPSGETLLRLVALGPVMAPVEPRLDGVDPMPVDESDEVVRVEPVVPSVLPEKLLPGGQLRPVIDDVVDVEPIGLATPVGLVDWPVGLVVDPTGPAAVPGPVVVDGPMGPGAGPVSGPGGLAV